MYCLVRIAGEPMYSWEPHNGCSYLLLGTDVNSYYDLNLKDAKQACTNADSNARLASIRTEDEWRGVKTIIANCKIDM